LFKKPKAGVRQIGKGENISIKTFPYLTLSSTQTSKDDSDQQDSYDVKIDVSFFCYVYELLVISELFQSIILHPDYRVREKYHNIALLKLEHEVKFSYNIWPACIHPDSGYQKENLIIAALGRIDLADSELIKKVKYCG
jgi:hypothetical protein